MAELIAGIDRARDAIGRGSWAEAYAQLRSLDPSSLGSEDLEGLADAAWWLSRSEESFAARQRAYSLIRITPRDIAGAGIACRDPRSAWPPCTCPTTTS